MGLIYGLYCTCHDYEIRYVGQTIRDMKARFRSYRTACSQGKPWPVIYWMRKHGLENISWEILEEAEAEILNEREIFWIEKMGTYGTARGLNATKGGGGAWGWKMTPEQIAAHSARNSKENHPAWGKHLSDEHKKRLSESLRGREFTQEHRRKIGEANRHRDFPAETRKKMSDARKQFMSDPTNRQRLSEYRAGNPRFSGENAHAAKLNQNKADQIRELFSTGDYSKAELARRFEVSPATIGNVISGRKWNGPDSSS